MPPQYSWTCKAAHASPAAKKAGRTAGLARTQAQPTPSSANAASEPSTDRASKADASPATMRHCAGSRAIRRVSTVVAPASSTRCKTMTRANSV